MIAAVVLSITAIPVTLPVLPVATLRHTPIVSLNYDAGETIGWPTYVSEIARVYESLSPSQRQSTIMLTSNYGEAGALDHYGPSDSLPAVYSGHNAYWYWGPPPASKTVVAAVGFSEHALSAVFGKLWLATHLDNHLGISDDEQGAPVWVGSDIRGPWKTIWPRLRHFG